MAPLPKKSRCVFKELGETGVCYVQAITEIPILDEYSVLIQVKACSLSSIDDKLLKKIYKATSRYPVGQDIAGIVRAVGDGVTMHKLGDEVVGVIPIDYKQSGCAEHVVLNEFEVTKKPENVTFVDAAGCIGDAVKAYTALHYLGRLTGGDAVLVLDGASSFGSLVVQLAHHWGAAKILTTASSDDEKLYLEGLDDQLAAIIDLSKRPNEHQNRLNGNMSPLLAACKEETGGLGVDLAIDNGAYPVAEWKRIANGIHVRPPPLASKREIIASLGVGARWITSNCDLQLDPPDTRALFSRCASVGFLFQQAWTHQGRYLHILMDIMEKISDGIIMPNIHHTISFETIPELVPRFQELRVGKVVVKMD